MATRIQKETKTTEGPGGSSVRTTTYESSRSYEHEIPRYTPGMQQRSVIINRSAPVKSGYSVQKSMSYGYGGGMGGAMMGGPGAYQAITELGSANIKTSRTKEKKDMQDLNERFASYIERVRFLEAQNRKLADELDKLKSKWGKETTAIKAMYEAELAEARKLLDDSEKEKARLQISADSLKDILDEKEKMLMDLRNALAEEKENVAAQNKSLSEYECEINLLNRTNDSLKNEHEKDKKEIARLTEALNRARADLDNETLNHIDAENRRQTLEEEIEFLRQVHEQEMKELAALAYRDTTNENREFWKNELGAAIREIQTTYDEKLEQMKGELETFYNMKVQEFRTGAAKTNMESVHSKEETKRLRGQLVDLRSKLADAEAERDRLRAQLANMERDMQEQIDELTRSRDEFQDLSLKRASELEAVLKELQDLMDSKLGLELEIAAYRKLLEGEENNIGLRQVVEQIIQQQDKSAVTLRESVTSIANRSQVVVTKKEESNLKTIVGDIAKTQSDSNLKVSQVVKGEMSAKTTYQRSAKGPVSIAESDAQGKFIVIENTGRREEALGGWGIRRNIDGRDKEQFKFPEFNLRPGGKIKIYSKGSQSEAGPNDLVAHFQSWDIGANITTKLVNQSSEERATHIQKTVYSS